MLDELKQVIVVRNDLKMGKGKIATQVAHAAVTAFYETLLKNRKIAEEWLNQGQKKIVVKVNSLDELLELYEKAKSNYLNVVLVEDRGLTQLPEGTITCIAIGPHNSAEIDKLTGKLKLL
jgi:PTH2 family peptidyl-tRNA hydrolase